MAQGFLPVTKKELLETGVSQPDFVYVVGDAYVDHPSFGAAIISRLLESQGYSVAMLPQRIGGAPRTSCGLESPNWHFW